MKDKQKGQVALIILLIMSVILTIGLSLISRSVSDVSISKDEEDSLRAFSAAEAGIEDALNNLTNYGPDPKKLEIEGGDLTAQITVNQQQAIENWPLEQNDSLDVNLAGAIGSQVTVSWEDGAALEMAVYHPDDTFDRYAYSSPGSGCVSDFTVSQAGPSQTINITSNDVLLRIRALCAPSQITVVPAAGGSLPIQEYKIDSRSAVSGKSKDSDDSSEWKVSAIEVTRTIPALPPIFDYVLFSKGSLGQ